MFVPIFSLLASQKYSSAFVAIFCAILTGMLVVGMGIIVGFGTTFIPFFICIALAFASTAYTPYIFKKLPTVWKLVMFNLLYIILEWCLGSSFILGSRAIPAISLGYSLVDSPFAELSKWSGKTGLTASVLFINLSILLLIRYRIVLPIICTILIVLTLIITDIKAMQTVPSINISAIQVATKWSEHEISALGGKPAYDLLLKATNVAKKSSKNSLIIWPETLVPGMVYEDGQFKIGLPISKQSILGNANFGLIGSRRFDKEGNEYNSAIFIDQDKSFALYDKVNLVPKSEDNFTAGRNLGVFKFSNSLIGLGICWDSLFPENIRKTAKKTLGPILFITNNAFAGNTLTSQFHMKISKLRAIETGRPVVHASAGGPSAFFDYKGNIEYSSHINETIILNGNTDKKSRLTLFIILGDSIIYVTFILFIILCFLNQKLGFRASAPDSDRL